jgi:hypothetical protein
MYIRNSLKREYTTSNEPTKIFRPGVGRKRSKTGVNKITPAMAK